MIAHLKYRNDELNDASSDEICQEILISIYKCIKKYGVPKTRLDKNRIWLSVKRAIRRLGYYNMKDKFLNAGVAYISYISTYRTMLDLIKNGASQEVIDRLPKINPSALKTVKRLATSNNELLYIDDLLEKEDKSLLLKSEENPEDEMDISCMREIINNFRKCFDEVDNDILDTILTSNKTYTSLLRNNIISENLTYQSRRNYLKRQIYNFLRDIRNRKIVIYKDKFKLKKLIEFYRVNIQEHYKEYGRARYATETIQ